MHGEECASLIDEMEIFFEEHYQAYNREKSKD